MKYVSMLLLAAIAAASPAKAGDVVSVLFGNHSKVTVSPSERDQIQRFYRDVLGGNVATRSDTFDLIRIGTDFYMAVAYDASAPSGPDLLKSIWLELKTNDPEGLKHRILNFGIKAIETRDKEHFTFQAPGGQVFRLVGNTEDLSRYER
jgi:hypothetical protein